MQFLTRHLPVAGRIEAGLFERVDEPLFPPIALREALVNAFCHRDYAQAGGAVSVAIYDDRLEIWSSGGLPLGIEVEDLKRASVATSKSIDRGGLLPARLGGTLGTWHTEDC